MIDVKILRKSKANRGASVKGGVITNANAYNVNGVVQEAIHAARADLAIHAEQADLAQEAIHASMADNAKEADHAAMSHDLDPDSPVRKQFLSRLEADTARGRKIFLDGVETGEYVRGLSGAEVDADGNAEVESARVRKDAAIGRNATVGNAMAVGKAITVGNYVPGAGGGSLWIDDAGEAHFDTAYLTVNKRMNVKEIEVQERTHVGGCQVSSPAAMTCCSVQELSVNGSVAGWRCFFRAKSGDGARVSNDFRVGDFARCETFNLERDSSGRLGNRYYWRRVMAAGTTGPDEAGDVFGYIDLSNNDGEFDPAGADCAPAGGDRIVVMGSETPSRQNVIVMASYGEGSPYIYQYAGIDGFSLGTDKLKTRISPEGNRFTGTFVLEAEGKEEELTSWIGRRTPYSLKPDSPVVVMSGGDTPVFSPSRITCRVYHGAGTDGVREAALTGIGTNTSENLSLKYVVRRYDAATGNYVDDAERNYSRYVVPTADMRSVTFRLYLGGELVDTVAVGIQADSTGLAAEYRATLEVTERKIAANAEAATALDKRVGSLEVTADAVVSQVGKLSRNLATAGRWSVYPSDPFVIDEADNRVRIYVSEAPDGMAALQCPLHIADFEAGTDYTLTFDMSLSSIVSGQTLPADCSLRAALAKVDSTGRIAPIATSSAVTPSELSSGARYGLHFQTFDPMPLPSAPLYLLVYMDWAASLRWPNRLEISSLKLEEGAVPTPYCPPGGDLESRIEQTADQVAMSVRVDGVERAGVRLDADEGITLDAEKVRILSGGVLTALFSGGMLNAALVSVGKLMTVIGGKRRISLSEFDDAYLRFYHDDGVTVAAKVGLESVWTKGSGISTAAVEDLRPFGTERQAIVQVFDKTGKLTWLLACDTGPYTPDNQPYRWRSYSLVPESASNTDRLRHSTDTVKATEYWQFLVDASLVQPDDKYLQYSGRLFTRKLADGAFDHAAAYYASGTLFHPSVTQKPQLVGYTGPDEYVRYYYEVKAGSMGARKQVLIS